MASPIPATTTTTTHSIPSHTITPSQSTIPQLPLSHFSAAQPSPQPRTLLLEALRNALLSTGFLYLTHLEHHLPPSLTARLVAILPRIFEELSTDQKCTAALVNTPHFLGYSSFGTETTAGGRDQREQFEFAGERGVRRDGEGELTRQGQGQGQDQQPLYTRLRGPNQYPDFDGKEELRQVVGEYIAAVQRIAEEFLGLVDEALGLEGGTLEGFARDGQDRLKLVHYWTGDGEGNGDGARMTNGDGEHRQRGIARGHDKVQVQEFVQGVGPHKDSSGWLTFLLQASPGTRGLQALSKDGEWSDVPPVEGSLVVNMGQAFEAATNGVCKATTHRVLLPKGMGSRYSVPFFMGVRPSLTKAELQGLWKQFDPEKWQTRESEEGMMVDSPFLRGGFETWGEAQLRTKIRSHRDVGERWYGDVFEKYVNGS